MILYNKIDKTINYCKKKRFSNATISRYLYDCLIRYILYIEQNTKNNNIHKIELVDILKMYYNSDACIMRYNNIINNLDTSPYMTENCKLLLKKCIYFEFIFQNEHSLDLDL